MTKTLSERVKAGKGLRPALKTVENHITDLLNSCVDYIKEQKIPAKESDIGALRKTFYNTNIGDLSAITPDQIKLITRAYFIGKGIIQ